MKIIRIGRKSDNDVVINDSTVSGYHLEIKKEDNGQVFITDLDSTNGTFVNGNQLIAHKTEQIDETDIVRVGNTVLPWRNYFDESSQPAYPEQPASDAYDTTEQKDEFDDIKDYMQKQDNEYEYAGFWLRFLAYIIDGFIVTIGLMIVLFLLIPLGIVNDIENSNFLIQVISILAMWLYWAGMESSEKQATLGKLALGLKVVDTDGYPISFSKATGRHFAKIISGLILYIGFMMAGWTEKKQALHDMMTNCLVVKKV